jgi:hypothetical protein
MLPFSPPPSPMGAGMMPPDMGTMPAPPMGGMNPMVLMQSLMETEEEWENEPPPNCKKPKKPTPQQIWTDAMREEGRNTERNNRMMDTVARLRFERVGVFPADQRARELGDQDEWKASGLVDDYNMLCNIVASMEESFHKRVLNRDMTIGAQTLEDAARFFREEEIYRWARSGDMPLNLAEIKVAACYGMVAARILCNLDDPEFPFDIQLIDPMSLYIIPGGVNGPSKYYRTVRMTQAEAYATWGEPRKKDGEAVKKLTDGKDDGTAIITVCEYADTLYRAAVLQGGIELLPVTEHKYYSVPLVVQGGPAGEPLFTDTARASTDEVNRIGGDWWRSGPMDDWGMKHKLTSSIAAQQDRHDQLEAVMARIVTSLQDATDPAIILKRDGLTTGMPLPKIDRRRGRVSEIGMGEDVIPVPTQTNPQDLQTILGALQQDAIRGQIPLGMFGQQPGSNITGNSMSVAAESGMDHITPWVATMESFQTRKIEKMLDYWQRKGNLARFYKESEHPFMVPVHRPVKGQDLARELKPSLIREIGPRVKVTKTRMRLQDLIILANAAGPLTQIGMPARRIFERMGEEDYDRLRDEWQEEQEWTALMSDPEMMQSVKIPMRIYQWAQEATNPEERAMYMALLDMHMQKQMAAAQPPAMPAGAPAPGMQPGPLGAPTGPPSPGPGLGAPGLGNMMNQPAMGAPPGAMGAPVGRPPGVF